MRAALKPTWKFDMFYRGLFTRPAGLIYDLFDDRICRISREDANIQSNWPRYVGHDFGPVNMAAIWQLPIVYVVENNAYGMGTAFSRVSRTEIITKSASYGIPAHRVDGQDVLETYAFFRDLVTDIRGGAGPQYVDLQTYRFRGHSMSDPASGTYRSVEEVEQAKKDEDPIARLRDTLMAAGVLDAEGLEAMDAEARAIAKAATDFADSSPVPEPDALYQNVWADVDVNGRLFFDGRSRD